MKNFSEKFGEFEKSPYLCTTFRFEKNERRPSSAGWSDESEKQSSEKFFKNFSRKIWRVRKKVLPLQPLSEISLKANVQEKKFEGTTFFEDIEQQSFILSFKREISKQYL